MDYLNEILLEAQQKGRALSEQSILDEIKFRESSHGIQEESALCATSLTTATVGVPPIGSHLYPPLIQTIQPGTVASFPLRFSHADTYLGEGDLCRTVLVGDAAHTIHPLAGQGLNMGLGDVDSLFRCIEDAVIHGGDIGEFPNSNLLKPYQFKTISRFPSNFDPLRKSPISRKSHHSLSS
jgi:ubiquinone biosynthesis monooxygenase Coq6